MKRPQKIGGMSKGKSRRSVHNKPKYLAYRNNDTREKNKAYKLIRHLERRPNDLVAQSALDNLFDFCVKSARKKLKEARKL